MGLHSEAFYRDTELRKQGIPIEHTLFADPAKIWDIAEDLDINQPQELREMHFSDDVPEGGEPATHIKVPYPHRGMVVDYRYDPDLGAYLRWDGGEPHIDALTGEQISVTNVIVAYATHVDTDIYEDEPRRNHPSVQIQLWGTGPAVVFRDGQAFEGIWARPERDDMLVFRDSTGQIPIALKPGNTWIQLAPLEGLLRREPELGVIRGLDLKERRQGFGCTGVGVVEREGRAPIEALDAGAGELHLELGPDLGLEDLEDLDEPCGRFRERLCRDEVVETGRRLLEIEAHRGLARREDLR